MTRANDFISYMVIDRILTAAITMGMANPISTATDAPVIDTLAATAIGQMLILQHNQSCCGIRMGNQPSRDWVAGYQFTREATLTRNVALESLVRFEEGPVTVAGYDLSVACKFVHAIAFALIAQTFETHSRTAMDDVVTPWAGGVLGRSYYALADQT